jgi:hypothetical protein
MTPEPVLMVKRIRLAGGLLIAGLLVELITLHWSHPTAFLFFMFLGGTLMVLGIVIYLISLVSVRE